MANDEKKDGNEMNALQEVKTNELAQMIKLAFMQDAEIKTAIMQDQNAIAKILQSNIIDEIKQELKQQKLFYKYNYENEKQSFLDTCKSENTKSGYNYALKDFETFCNQYEIENPIACTPSNVDMWLLNQRTQNKAPSTIRRNAGALSAFFAYIERKSNGEIRNPVQGTKARPKVTATRKTKFYSMGNVDATHLQQIAKDVETILQHEHNKELKAIISIMAYRGLRCGSFEQMTIHGEQFRTVSKGEEVKGVLPAICLQEVINANVKRNEPFTTWTSNRVKQNVKNHCKKLYDEGLISFKYSAHDFRHFFALSEYELHHDIYKLSKLLNHSGIAVTENYLRGLHVEI